MASQAAWLQQVEALRQARLDAESYSYQLEQARNELEAVRQHAAALEAQQTAPPEPHPSNGGAFACVAADALEQARLQAADDRYKLQLTELELAKQLDALNELQWQLECVVAQLGLAPPAGAQSSGADIPAGAACQDATLLPAPTSDGIDHMLLLTKVEELRQAQAQLGEYKRRLAVAEAELSLQQQHQTCMNCKPGAAVPKATRGAGAETPTESPSCNSVGEEHGEALGRGGQQFVGALLQENGELRRRLAEAEENYRSLERDYEVELLVKAEAQEQREDGQGAGPCAAASSPAAAVGWQAAVRQSVHTQLQASLQSGRAPPAELQQTNGDRCTQGTAAGLRRALPTSESMDLIARQRLAFRLQEKDKQLAKMRGVVRELEVKLIEARKHQADLVMMESSWREQEVQDRRIAQLEDERARLDFAATSAQAEAEAARKEAAVQRRLLRRLQEQAAAAAQAGLEGGAGGQMVELLQKRVKVLEAQNIRLRLQAKTSREEEELAAAQVAAVQQRAARQRGTNAGGSDEQRAAGGNDPAARTAATTAGENDSPNRTEAEGSSVLDIPFARWEADKRLQKRVETLQMRLRDKTTALVSADAARRRAEEQLEAAQTAAQQAHTSLQRAQVQLQAAHERAAPDAMVPVCMYRQVLAEAEQAQQRFDELERRHAALQHKVPAGSGASNSGVQSAPDAQRAVTAASQCEELEACETSSGTPAPASGLDAAQSTTNLRRCLSPGSGRALLQSSSSKLYQPADYGGGGSGCPNVTPGTAGAVSQGAATSVGQAEAAAQLLKQEVSLFDAQLHRNQAVSEAERHRRRLLALLDRLSPHPSDSGAAAAIAEARQLAGLPAMACSGATQNAGGGPAQAPSKFGGRAGGPAGVGSRARSAAVGGGAGSGRAAAAASKRRQPSCREQELLDTVALLKAALERTKKGLQSGVSSSKYMAAVDKAKQLRAHCQALEAQLEDAGKVRDELAQVQRELGALHSTAAALRSQVKAAKEQREQAGVARENMLAAQVSELERALRERDAQMEALQATTEQVSDEVRVLIAEGLRPADLIQELLLLRPRVREVEAKNADLCTELAGLEDALARDMAALQADHELLQRQCRRWESELRAICAKHGEALPLGLA